MKLRPFELALVVGFSLLMVLSIILINSYEPEVDKADVPFGQVTIWGTLPVEPFLQIIKELVAPNATYNNVYYQYVDPANLRQALTNALADGNPPDLIFASHEAISEIGGRLQTFPATSFPNFRSIYIDGAEILTAGGEVYAYPVALDPLVMYWNRDLFAFSNLITPPATWETIVAETVPSLVVRDSGNNTIRQPAIAFGGYKNVRNFFPIISMLLLQGGSEMAIKSNNIVKIRLDSSIGSSSRPLTNAVTYYTNFSSKTNTLYTWDDYLGMDRDLFINDKLAIYFGFGSEGREIENYNPNLNFDIALVPQAKDATVKRTYGRFYGLFVTAAAKNKDGAYKVLTDLVSSSMIKRISDAYNFAPATRSLLLAGTNDKFGRISYISAPWARGWLSPNIRSAEETFGQMIVSVNGDRNQIYSHVDDAIKRLEMAY